MKIVLGLGNPGERYHWTRHNLGFRVVDRLCERWGCVLQRRDELKRTAWTGELRLQGRTAILSKPRTYMNRVGRAALALCDHYGASPRELLVVYDDADLALGRVRIRSEGGAGGHNGIHSLIASLGTEAFPRIRLGIRGHGRCSDLAEYVLEEFEPDEAPLAQALVDLGTDASEVALVHGLVAAMDRFNGLSVLGGGEEDSDATENAAPGDSERSR